MVINKKKEKQGYLSSVKRDRLFVLSIRLSVRSNIFSIASLTDFPLIVLEIVASNKKKLEI